MNCDNCVKLNPLPACIDSDVFLLTGLTFPDFLNDVLIIRITDMATGRVENFPELIDGTGVINGGFDIASIFPLMQHYYKIEFLVSGAPANFLLTNPDGSESTGCCAEFFATDLTASDSWPLSDQTCAV